MIQERVHVDWVAAWSLRPALLDADMTKDRLSADIHMSVEQVDYRSLVYGQSSNTLCHVAKLVVGCIPLVGTHEAGRK